MLVAICATAADKPQIENAKVETHAFSGSLAAQLKGLGGGPLWAGYAEPMVPGRGDMCWQDGNGDWEPHHADGVPVRLEGPTTMVVLLRVENGSVERLKVTSADCRLDGGGLPFHWIDNVPASASAEWLGSQANATTGQTDRWVYPLSLQAGSEAARELKSLATAGKTEHIRQQAVLFLSSSKAPGSMDTVLEVARKDASPKVRGRALFWIARKVDPARAESELRRAIKEDAEKSVRDQAVSALRDIPEGRGIPALIEMARREPDATLRKRAMTALEQSKDPRALEFFAEVLKN